MGTPEFAIPTLKSLIDSELEVVAVVTQPDRPKGRGRKLAASPVKSLALEHNIIILQPERVGDKHFHDLIKSKTPDVMVVVAFGQLLNRDLLALPKYGAINIHSSLLPKYRGAAPIQWAVMSNESVTGLTVMRMDEGMDTGPILLQEEVPILKDETAGQLHDRLALKAGELIIRFLNKAAEGQIKEVPQDNSSVTYAPKIDKGIGLIAWDRDAETVSALIRALDPSPGAYTTLGEKRIKLFSSSVPDDSHSSGIPGRVIRTVEGSLRVETGKGIVEIGGIQYPGKKRLIPEDFLRGFKLPEGTILGG